MEALTYLKEWRKGRGLTQRQLSELCRVHQVSIHRLETGQLIHSCQHFASCVRRFALPLAERVKPNSYGMGAHADQYGRTLQPVCPSGYRVVNPGSIHDELPLEQRQLTRIRDLRAVLGAMQRGRKKCSQQPKVTTFRAMRLDVKFEEVQTPLARKLAASREVAKLSGPPFVDLPVNQNLAQPHSHRMQSRIAPL